MYVYICTYVCMYVCVYVCLYVYVHNVYCIRLVRVHCCLATLQDDLLSENKANYP